MPFFSTLERFNEKYEKLISLKFCESIKNFRYIIKYLNPDSKAEDLEFGNVIITKKTGNKQEHIIVGPEGEEIDSFILTFRFFIQKNESISIKNLKGIYNDASINESLRKNFFGLTEKLNNFLDENVRWAEYGRVSFSRRDILFMVVYGLYAHSNKRYIRMYQKYFKENDNYLFAFFSTIKEVINILREIYFLNKKTLESFKKEG